MSDVVFTQYGEGRIVDHSTVRGRTQYKVAGLGFEVWLDEVEVSKRTASNPKDRYVNHTYNESRDRGEKEQARQDWADRGDHDDFADVWEPEWMRHGSSGFDFEPSDHTWDNSTDLPYDWRGRAEKNPVEMYDSESSMSPDHETLDPDEVLQTTDSRTGEEREDRVYPGPAPHLFVKEGWTFHDEDPDHGQSHWDQATEHLQHENELHTAAGWHPPHHVTEDPEFEEYLDEALHPDRWDEEHHHVAAAEDMFGYRFSPGYGAGHGPSPFDEVQHEIHHPHPHDYDAFIDPMSGERMAGLSSKYADIAAEVSPGSGARHPGHPDSWPFKPNAADYADWDAKHPDFEEWVTKQGSWQRPAGLDHRYADIIAEADHYGDPVQRFKDDPVRELNRHGHQHCAALSASQEAEFDSEHLLRQADKMHRTAAWKDVRQKAMRLKREGKVKVKAILANAIYTKVAGDNGNYECMIIKGGSYGKGAQTIDQWDCTCPWGKWAFKRKISYVGRLCSHGYATYLIMQSKHISENPGNFRPKNSPYRKTKAASVDGFKTWLKDFNGDHIDLAAADNYLTSLEEPASKEDAAAVYDYVDSHHSEHPERDFEQDGYSNDPDDAYKTAGDLLRTQPGKMTPHLVQVPELSDEDHHYFTDLGDDRKTTGPDQIMARRTAKGEDKITDHHPDFAWHEDGQDDMPEQGIVKFCDLTFTADEDLLNKLRDLSSEDEDEHLGDMRDHNREVSEVVDELIDRGYAAAPMVAMKRAALRKLAIEPDYNGNSTDSDIPSPNIAPPDMPDHAPAPASGPAGGPPSGGPDVNPGGVGPHGAPSIIPGAGPAGGAAPASQPKGGPATSGSPAQTWFGNGGFDTGGDWHQNTGGGSITPKSNPKGFADVTPGDTMSSMADRAGVSLGDLEKANPQIKDPNLIHPGDKMNLPTGFGGPEGIHGGGGGANNFWTGQPQNIGKGTPGGSNGNGTTGGPSPMNPAMHTDTSWGHGGAGAGTPTAPAAPAAGGSAGKAQSWLGKGSARHFAELYFQADDDDSRKKTVSPTPSPTPATNPNPTAPQPGAAPTPGANQGAAYPAVGPSSPGTTARPGVNGEMNPTNAFGVDLHNIQPGGSTGTPMTGTPGSPSSGENPGQNGSGKKKDEGGMGGGGMGGAMQAIGPLMSVLPGLAGTLGPLAGGLASGLGHIFHLSRDPDLAQKFAAQYMHGGGDFLSKGGPDWMDFSFAGSGPDRKDWMGTSEDYVKEHETGNRDETWMTDRDGDINVYKTRLPEQGPKTASHNLLAVTDEATGLFNPKNRPYQEYDKGDSGTDEDNDADEDQTDENGQPKPKKSKGKGGEEPGLPGMPKLPGGGGGGAALAEEVPMVVASLTDDGIARQAQRLLRTAGRVYSLAEQRELEEESHPKGARNLGGLNLAGTHYLDND